MNTAAAQTADPFDFVAFAKAHGYRQRNVNDGVQLPPAWRPARNRTGAGPGYQGKRDRCDAICARLGYVTDDGGGRIGWVLLTTHRKAFKSRLSKIEQAGGVVTQLGDLEAAGTAALASIWDILESLGVWRRASCPFSPTVEGILDHRIDATPQRAVRDQPRAPAAVEPRFRLAARRGVRVTEAGP